MDDIKDYIDNDDINENINDIDDSLLLCQLPDMSCFGCCGFEFTSKKEVAEALDKNTFELDDFSSEKDRNLIDLKGFRDRINAGILRACGICYNLVWLDRHKHLVFCPLHPKSANYKGQDLRKGHCNPGYLCRTAYEFSRWPQEKRERYIRFVKEKNPDWYEYSIMTDNGALLEEFNAKNNILSSNI